MILKKYPANEASISAIQQFVREIYQKAKYNKRTIREYELLSEEILLKLIEAAPYDAEISVSFEKQLGGNKLIFSCPGKEVDLTRAALSDFSSIITSNNAERFNQSRRHGTNYITLSTNTSSNVMIKQFLFAAFLAVMTCLILYFALDKTMIDWIIYQVSGPLTIAFIKLLQCFAVPTAILSLVTYIINYHDSVEYDDKLKMVSLRFVFSSLIAILIAYLVWKVTSGLFENSLFLLSDITKRSSFGHFFGSSLSEIITRLIPDNFLEIFTVSNPFPMLLFAVVLGCGINRFSGKSNARLRIALNDLMDLISHLISMVFAFLPIFLYFAILQAVLYRLLKGELLKLALLSVTFALIILCGFLLLYGFYCLQLCAAHISPIAFYKKYKDVLRENWNIASNIDALPYNHRTLRRKFRNSSDLPLIHSILNLGTLMNMDGNCLIITISILFFSNMFVGDMPTMAIIEMFIIIFLLGIGSPNQPGSFTVSSIVLFSFLRIDMSYASFIIIIEAIFCKLYSATNAFGDIITVVVNSDDELKQRSFVKE